MIPELARAAARDLAKDITESLARMETEGEFPITNLGEVFYLGAYVVRAMAQYWKPSKTCPHRRDVAARLELSR
jgi:hypothetical protein